MIGNIVNSGTVNVQGNGFTDATVGGFYINGDLAGNFSNSGSIATVATDQTDDAVAYGLYVDEDLTGNTSNSGSIASNATAANLGLDTDTQAALAGAAGFYIDEDFDGNFSNSGSISTVSVADNGASNALGQAYADGLVVNGEMTGNISNSGTISVSAESEFTVGASGFHIDDNLDGDFSNSGSIAVNVILDGGEVEAWGLYVGEDATGDVDTSGNTRVSVMQNGGPSGNAKGIHIEGDLNGAVENSGTVVTSFTGTADSASAQGIVILGDLGAGSGIRNSGSIISRAESEGGSFAGATGMLIRRAANADIENASIINATVTGSRISTATATGINISGGMTGTLPNSGTISAAVDGASSAVVNGVSLAGGLVGDLLNSGTVSVSVQGIDGDGGGSALAVYASAMTGNIENSGTLVAIARGDGSFMSAAGINIRNTLDGNFNNNGTISVLADNARTGSASTVAIGIYIGDTSGVVTNSGSITATAIGVGAEAYGIKIDNFDGVITDVGTISAKSEGGDAYAIYLGSGTGTLNVDTEDNVTGTMRVEDHNVNLDARGGSSVFFFEGAATAAGTFTTTVSDGRSAWYVQDEGGSNPIYASVDSVDVFTPGNIIASYGGLVGSAGRVLSYSTPGQVARGFAFSENVVNRFRPYALVDVQSKQFEQPGGSDTNLNLLNGSFGVSGQFENGWALAVGIGVFTADGDSDTTSFETNAVYLNAAVGRQFGDYTVEADIGIGFLSNDKACEISGSPDAKGDYDSTLYTAGLNVERPFNLQSNFDLLGFGSLRYTRQDDDRYTETSSLANATVGEVTLRFSKRDLGSRLRKPSSKMVP